jgi:hypothetical protein
MPPREPIRVDDTRAAAAGAQHADALVAVT